MSVASDTVRALEVTASATVHAVEAAGGAIVGAVNGAARGTVEGAVSGARSGMNVPAATVLGVVAIGLTGLVDWPVALAAGGVASAVHLLRRTRTESGNQAASERPQSRERKSARPRQSTAGSRRSRTAAQ
ncbi:hypothetical protein [Nocardia aurantiaca]|uniref:Transmembrane protein n=1 Tax=Nocardia aurantiaca TaxID=2675850 RepID=A0A6I3L0A7_9NOCA|nr:hypothetical protein [Nocardia aurantiaca]MTE15191.1 hypothetical protein [Nocardia aurantiaca]